MSILNKVTIASLKKNKVRTLVTIIGIILSLAMFTAVSTSIVSIQHFMIEAIENTTGCWYASFSQVNTDDGDAIEEDTEISDVVAVENIG